MVSLEDHYDALRARDRYEPVEGADREPLALGDLPPAEVRRRFVVGEDARAFADGAGTDGVLTFGVSVTGPPHVGTLGQMQTALALQRAGFDVQFVVADFEPYSTQGYALDVVRERARRFVAFVDALGFDGDRGRLRTQYGAADVTHTAYHLARYADPERDQAAVDLDDTAWERANRDAYDAAGVDATALGESDRPEDWAPSEFTQRMDGFLMVADMLHPLVADDYPANCIVMGADERALRPMVDGVRDRCGTDGTLHALYTRLVPGLDDRPKASRRLPESRFTLADDPEGIRAAVRGDPDAPWTVPDDVVVEAMRLASAADAEQVAAWRRARADDPEAWNVARAAFADELAGYAKEWQATAEN
jgi:tryptophanyl-tRNA synthetase